MTSNNITPASLVYNGEIIRDKGEMLSLTDMWKASGSDPARRPVEWLRGEHAQRFITFMSEDLGMGEVGKSHFGLVSASRGGQAGGATFAHWQIAMAYAKYLSPAFHAWCNEVVRERMEGKPAFSSRLSQEDIAIIGNVVKNCSGLMVREYVRELVPALVEKGLLEEQAAIVRGLTAGDVLDVAGWRDRKGLRGLSGYVSSRLRRFCAQKSATVKLGTLGASTAYVFDRLTALEWLDAGGRLEIEHKVAQRRGQGVLSFPRVVKKPSNKGGAS